LDHDRTIVLNSVKDFFMLGWVTQT
jgi:hypothetical protein